MAASVARKDELRRWLKARRLKTTGRKQAPIDSVIKAKEDGTETIEERETREKKVRETRAVRNCAVHWRIFQILKP